MPHHTVPRIFHGTVLGPAFYVPLCLLLDVLHIELGLGSPGFCSLETYVKTKI